MRIGAGDIVFIADDIGLLDLIVVRFPAILSIEANLSVIRTVPVLFTVIPFPDITTIVFLMIIIVAIIFPAVATMVIVFLTVAVAIIFLAVAFLTVSPLPVICVFIGLISKEAVLVIVAVWV